MIFRICCGVVLAIIIGVWSGCGHVEPDYKIVAEPYRVQAGDTVYSIACDIARRHADKKIDINRLSYAIKHCNGIRDGYIVPGQVLMIPDYVDI